MKLLFRRDLEFAAMVEDEACTDITASFYRRSVDTGYHQLIMNAAEQCFFDCFILQCVRILLDQGMPFWIKKKGSLTF